MDNKLIIAAAGSGKTTELIKESLENNETSILISTYTEANASEIRNKFIKKNGSVPSNITIQTWFSLLIKHGVKPFQSVLFNEKVKGMILVSRKSGFRFNNRNSRPIFWGEKDFYRYYFTNDMKIYSDKLSKLVCRINSESDGKIVDRLTNIYPVIFVDECQDLAGYDLDIIKLLSTHTQKLRLVCDPRQVTYLTHNESKYKKYRNGLIEDFINTECKKIQFNIDKDSLSHSYRCNQAICDFSNKLYPDIHQCDSLQTETTDHDGIFLVDINNKDEYLDKHKPIQLRWSIANKEININYRVYKFGQSKGLTFDRVLIYPTEKMIDWMQNHDSGLSDAARAKLYVGLTRAKFSVGIVCDTSLEYDMTGLNLFE
jgi:DNA helicase-2/ATP-dependent DNA helicase PcrA